MHSDMSSEQTEAPGESTFSNSSLLGSLGRPEAGQANQARPPVDMLFQASWRACGHINLVNMCFRGHPALIFHNIPKQRKVAVVVWTLFTRQAQHYLNVTCLQSELHTS